MKTKIMFSVILVIFCFSCGCSNPVGTTINKYHAARPQVQLGMDKDDVLSILEPTQDGLSLRQTRGPEQYTQDGIHVEIHFFRSGANYDKILTDDEFTPYIFHDGKLVAVGWTAIGGPKHRLNPSPNSILQLFGKNFMRIRIWNSSLRHIPGIPFVAATA